MSEKEKEVFITIDGVKTNQYDIAWDLAKSWQIKANNGIHVDDHDIHFKPLWCWDSGFKLDYDGNLLKISSRFYPPFPHYDDSGWDGDVAIIFLDDTIKEKSFHCESLEDLKSEVESYVNGFVEKIKSILEDE